MRNRDDFPLKTKRLLAERVNFFCSNPKCNRPTSGPSTNPDASISIGVAAHITAAAPGGKRFDPTMSPAERKSIKNGIWLCQVCAKLIDSDDQKYTVEVLHDWKRQAEGRIAELLEGSGSTAFTGSTMIVAQANFLDQLAGYLTSDTEKDLEQRRNEWRMGKKQNVRLWLQSLKEDTSRWDVIAPKVKAKILRFEAGLELDTTNNVQQAKEIADEAFALDPSTSNEAKIRALIARHEFGAKEAIGILEHQSDIDSRNLLAAFYLELNDKANSQRILDDIFQHFEPNAETYRVQALLLLVEKNIDRASVEIENARELAPSWVIVLYTSAVIDYYAALSISVIPDQLMLFPEPVDMVLVKQDVESVGRVQRAETTFSELLSKEENEAEGELLEAWLLACRMVNPDRHSEAIQQVKKLLDSNPSSFHAIYWALARNIDIEWHRSLDALSALVTSNAATINHIIALVGILAKQKAFNEANDVLLRTKDVFSKSHAEDLWLYWNVQILLLSGRIKSAQKLVNRHKDVLEPGPAQSLILAATAHKTKDIQDLVKYLETQYEKTRDALILLQLCEFQFRNQNWDYVADRVDELLPVFRTAEVTRLAVYAVFNARRFNKCLELINAYAEQVRGKELPSDIRQIRAICFHAQGQIKDAIKELEEMTLDKSSVEVLIRLARLYYESGDLRKLSLLGRQLISIPQMKPEEALSLAHALRQEDFSMAQHFWRIAVSQELPDTLVLGALSLGYSLGLDKELFGLSQRMQEIAQAGTNESVQLLSLSQFIEMQKQFNQQQIDVNTLYQEGKIPVHILSEKINVPLTDLYHSFIVEGEKQASYISRNSLFIRHGGKAIGTIENAQQYQLNIDITAVLLASHLGILGDIEKVFHSIRIPSELIPSLIEMRDKMLHHQPSRLDVANHIIDLVDRRLLKTVDAISLGDESGIESPLDSLEFERKALYKAAQARNGYILDFRAHLEAYAHYSASPKTLYAKNIADALLELGKLSKDSYPIVLQNLGTEGENSDFLTVPETGIPIFCFENVVSVLADAEILEMACNQFEIFIESKYLQQLRNEVAYFEKSRKQQFEWIGSVVHQLRNGLDTKKYQLIPLALTKNDEHELYGLHALFSLSNQGQNLIWIDDRFLNGYSNINGIPVVGTNDILNTLVASGEISEPKYLEVLHRMRADNLFFVPLNPDEIVYYIREAPLKANAIVETFDLSILRHYIASAFLRGRILQKPPAQGESPNPQGELEFVFHTAGAVADAIERIWSLPEITLKDKEIYSGWISDNLFVSHLGLSEAIGLEHEIDNAMNLSALSFATLITRSFTIIDETKTNGMSLQRDYLNWVYERVLRKSFETNPAILKKTAEILKIMLVGIKNENTAFEESEVNKYIQRFCSIFPGQIFAEMKKDDNFARAIGLTSVVSLETWELKPEDFWYAAFEAVNGRTAEVMPLNADRTIVFGPYKQPDGITCVLVHDSDNGESALIQDSGLELLNESKDIQLRYLQKHRDWFDLPQKDFELVCNEISSTGSLQERVEKALKWKETNLRLFYSQLFVYLRDNRQFTSEHLIPSDVDGMLRCYRLKNYDTTKPFGEQWESAIDDIIKSHGIEHALERASCVPLSLPESLLDSVDNMSLSEKRGLVKKLLRVSKSPIATIQLTKLLVRLAQGNAIFRRLANYEISFILSEQFGSNVDTFLAVLQWMNYQFAINPDIQNLPAEVRLLLIWAHSHHIYSIFVSLGVDLDWLLNTFKQNINPPTRLFEHETNFEDNVLHIRHVSTQIFITYGITYLIRNYQELLPAWLKEAVINFVTIRNEDLVLPHPFLIGNPARAENPLNSFLGQDLSEQLRELMGENSTLFEYANWKSLALATIQNLKGKSANISSWIDLFAVVGTLRVDDDVSNEMVQALRSINFQNLFEDSIELGEKAIHIASLQLSLIKDSAVLDYLRAQVIEISEFLAARYSDKVFGSLPNQEQEKVSRLAGVLLEVALNISKQEETAEERALGLQTLGIEIAKRWKLFVIITRPVVQYLCEILPPSQAKHLWKFLLFMRAVN